MNGLEIDERHPAGQVPRHLGPGRCTWSSTSPGPAGCAGRTRSRRLRRDRARARWPCGWSSTTTPGFDLTEAGTQRKLAVYVVADPMSIPMVATLGPDPLTATSTGRPWPRCWPSAGRAQLKGVLKDQRTIAGIGNAYSDEILHAAKLEPVQAVEHA